jgi:hypothetical protein
VKRVRLEGLNAIAEALIAEKAVHD